MRWIKFAEKWINFEHVSLLYVQTNDEGAGVIAEFVNQTTEAEIFSTPRAAENRLEDLMNQFGIYNGIDTALTRDQLSARVEVASLIEREK
jgi:hypothetical protein